MKINDLATPCPSGQKDRIWKKIQSRINSGEKLAQYATTLKRNPAHHIAIRKQILARIGLPRTRQLFEQEKNTFKPSIDTFYRLRSEVLHRIETWQPVPAWHWVGKWVAATAAVALVMRMVPMLFIATPLQAESQNILLPTKGTVSITDGAQWSLVSKEMELDRSLTVRTGNDSAATILVSDVIFRLFENTEITIRSAAFDADTTEPIARISYGQIWGSSMMPKVMLAGHSVTLPQGTIALKDGSVNIFAGPQQTTIQVFHRFARVLPTGDEPIHLIQGDQLTLLPNGNSQRHLITESMRSEEWVLTNLQRDAVHRSQIAKKKQDFAEQVAGILPDSAFYFLKRASETIDIGLTLTEVARNEKKILNAQTRLNEAVALLKSGRPQEAEKPLSAFRESIQSIASLSEKEAQQLLQHSLAISTQTVADALPHSLLYRAKETVFEAAADAHATEITPTEVDLYLLSDALLEIESRIAQGEINSAHTAFKGIEGAVSSILEHQTLNGEPVSKENMKVVKTILRSIAFSLEQAEDFADSSKVLALKELRTAIDGNVPSPERSVVQVTDQQKTCMTLQEVSRLVNQFLSSVFTYKTPVGQRNAVLHQITLLPDCPESGRVLAKVMNKVPVFTRSFVWDAMQKMEATL